MVEKYMYSKFEISKLGSGTGKQFSGWGIYLSDKKETDTDIYTKGNK